MVNPHDPDPTPYFHLAVYGTDAGGTPAVAHLVEAFDRLFPRSAQRASTRVYLMPDE